VFRPEGKLFWADFITEIVLKMSEDETFVYF
jgi:hypothetical protein